MHYVKDATVSTIKFLDNHLTPRFNYDNLNRTTAQKVIDVAACTFVMFAGVVSFIAFPQLTLAGFVFGHIFRHQLREGSQDFGIPFRRSTLSPKQ